MQASPDFGLTDEQRTIRSVVHEFAVNELQPRAAQADNHQEFPAGVWDGLRDLELMAMTVPEDYGGLEVDRLTYAVINEEVAYGSLAVATALGVHGLAATCIGEFGDDEQRERWLPAMAAGDVIGAFALSEPHAGSNPAALTTEARREDGEYVLDGKKQWITNGSQADVFIVFAKTDPPDPSSITPFIIPKDTGVEVGEKERKLGLRASDTTPLTFDGVRIPATYRLTATGDGLRSALTVLTGGRIGIAAQAVGLAAAALDDAVTYSGEREQFGKPIGEIQTIRHKIAEMATKLQAARLLVRDAARREDAEEAVRMHASMAKYFASSVAMSVTNQAVQIHGGYGYVTDFDVERYYRDAKITEIYEGTTEIQKNIIARAILDS